MPRLKHAAPNTTTNQPQALANLVFAVATVGVSLALFLLSLSNASLLVTENIEKVLPLAFLAAVFAGVVALNRWQPINTGPLSLLISLAAVSLMVAQLVLLAYPSPDYPLTDIPQLEPLLVGLAVLIGVIIFWSLVFFGQGFSRARRRSRFVLSGVALLLAAFVLVFVALRNYRFLGWDLRQADSLPVLDEFVAVAFGRTPLSDYAGLYQNLLALPLQWLVGDSAPSLTGILTYLVALQVLIVAMAVLLIAFAIPRVWWWLGFMLFFSFLFLPSFLGLSVFDFWSNMPARYLFPTALGFFVLAFSYLRNNSRWASWARLLIAFSGGFVAGLSAINNLDFGIPAAGAFLFVVALTCFRAKRYPPLLVALGGLGVAYLSYTGYGFLVSEPIDWQMWAAFALSYQGLQWWAIPMPFLGTHLVILATLLATFAFGLYSWIRNGSGQYSRLNLLLIYFSVVGSVAFVYFAGRSHLGVTVSLNFFLGLCLALWLPAVIGEAARHFEPRRRVKVLLETLWPATWLGVAVFAFVWGIPQGIAQTRAVSAISVNGWYERGSIEAQGAHIAQALEQAKINPAEVGLLIPSSALIADAAKVTNTMLVPLPIYLADIEGLAEAQCNLWQRQNVKYVIGERPPDCSQPTAVETFFGRDLWLISP